MNSPWARNNMKSSNLSPRQVANRAYSLAFKKLDRDEKRRKPQYSVRERLLLSYTINRAEDLLNKHSPRSRKILNVDHDGDILPPKQHIPPPSPVMMEEIQPVAQIKQELPRMMVPTPEQIAAVSLVVVAAAYNSLTEQQQQQSLLPRDCRVAMIPQMHSMSMTTII
ncbi:hypothetical protein BDB01DRAFT_788711 [Pilobolus umbonatus]|nr:hypothetical protein BDB01DRAFT_788711 [Pilobolus umbonatus]